MTTLSLVMAIASRIINGLGGENLLQNGIIHCILVNTLYFS